MASSAHKTEKEKKEFFDSPEELDKKITHLAELIKKSKHFTAFTGAGISTSTGIPDFRSGVNTVLPTGPGAWEKKAKGIVSAPKKKIVSSMLKAIPSKTHMALVQLEMYGLLKFLISQNVDGLHRRSGFPAEKFAELHGNTNMEFCKKCGKKYMRDFRTRTANKVHDHETGRKCDNEKCKGKLYDSIINFGENLPEKDMNDGFNHSECSDLQLVLGSSLRVTPAADMPHIVGKKAKLIIVNLQATPLDDVAYLRINGMCDDVMVKLMEKLGLQIPQFTLQRRLQVQQLNNNNILVKGQDKDGSPYQIFKQIAFTQKTQNRVLTSTPFKFSLLPQQQQQNNSNKNQDNVQLNLGFYGHYGEPDYKLSIDLNQLKEKQILDFYLEYCPYVKKWVTCKLMETK